MISGELTQHEKTIKDIIENPSTPREVSAKLEILGLQEELRNLCEYVKEISEESIKRIDDLMLEEL